MRLLITDEVINEVSFDTEVMTSVEFNNIRSHPFIASSRFDAVVIDLKAKVQWAYIQQLLKSCLVIPKFTNDITSNGVTILCELYKDRAAELRINFIKNKDEFYRIVNDMKLQYDWERYY